MPVPSHPTDLIAVITSDAVVVLSRGEWELGGVDHDADSPV